MKLLKLWKEILKLNTPNIEKNQNVERGATPTRKLLPRRGVGFSAAERNGRWLQWCGQVPVRTDMAADGGLVQQPRAAAAGGGASRARTAGGGSAAARSSCALSGDAVRNARTQSS